MGLLGRQVGSPSQGAGPNLLRSPCMCRGPGAAANLLRFKRFQSAEGQQFAVGVTRIFGLRTPSGALETMVQKAAEI